MNTILIRDGLLVEASRSWHADILIEGEKIARVEPFIDPQSVPQGTTIVNAEGLCVLPGLIDAHTHYHLISRGTVTADGFEEGSRLAAYGGVTTVIDFADHDKSRPLVTSSEERIQAMEEGMAIDFALHQGVYGIPETIKEELEAVKERGISAIKIFTTYKDVGYLIATEGLKVLFETCKALHMMISVHCEDDALITAINDTYKGDYRVADHPLLRPSEAEYRAIMAMGLLAKEVGIPLYIVHLSSAKGLEAVHTLRSQ
ncbi:MAG: amidohydrolase family protein, partial [Sphaerochaetaceae bacterium]